MLEAFYGVIQNIDHPADIYGQDLLPKDALNGVTFAELFWIYETFIKDCEWAMVGPSPDKVLDLVLQKLARRRQILQPDRSLIQNSATAVNAAPAKAAPVAPVKPKTANPSFDALVESLGNDSMTIRGNLEMGNFVEAPKLTDDGVSVIIGFHDKDILPREFLQDTDVMPKLRTKIASHFGVKPEKTMIKLVAVDEAEALRNGFTSLADRETKKHQTEVKEKREKLLNDPYIKEAEKLFGAKVDKVVLKDER